MITQILVPRKREQKTQKELAEEIGITTGFYSMIENGKRTPSVETLIKIQDALNIDKIDLREFR